METKKTVFNAGAVLGFIYGVIHIYNMVFSSEYLPQKYAKFIWNSFENSSLETQRTVLFIALIVWLIILYIVYYLNASSYKAFVFSIVFFIITILFGEGFWKVFLFIVTLPELFVLGVADLFCGLLRIINLDTPADFILGVLQLIMLCFTYVLSIMFFYAPTSFLEEPYSSSADTSNAAVVYREKEKTLWDEIEQYERDETRRKIKENLDEINSQLKRR